MNYTNLSRYSSTHEKTLRRHFEAGFGWERLNQACIAQLCPPEHQQLAVVDCTFLAKSGRHTYGLDWFYNGTSQRAERGLECSVVAIVDVNHHSAYTLSALQTEPGLSATTDSLNRMDFYVGHLAYAQSYFPPQVRYVVADGFYSKVKWVNAVVQLKHQAIGKLRADANLKFLYSGPQKKRGRPRLFAGKVNLSNVSALHSVCHLDSHVKLYTAVVWSVAFQRRIRIAYLLQHQQGKSSDAVLFSTDLELDAIDIYRHYKARFQIEFIFRDARQFTGLADCQARNADALDSHINASL